MNKITLINNIEKMVSELESTIKILEQQSKSLKHSWKETQKKKDLEKHFEIEKGISEIKDVVQALVNANNWAKRIGE
jgi:heme oxygenase